MEWTRGDCVLSDDPARLDLDAVCALLRATVWARDWPRSLVERAVRHSTCFGLYRAGRQIGLARVISDHATFAYLCDVVVHPGHRGRGLGTWMVHCLLAHPALQTLTQALRTHDAHRLYEKFGFERTEYLRRSTRGADRPPSPDRPVN